MIESDLNPNAPEFQMDMDIDFYNNLGALLEELQANNEPVNINQPPVLQRHVANAEIVEEQQQFRNIVNGLDIGYLDLSFLDELDDIVPEINEPLIYSLEYLAPALGPDEDLGPLDNLYFSPNNNIRRRNCPN